MPPTTRRRLLGSLLPMAALAPVAPALLPRAAAQGIGSFGGVPAAAAPPDLVGLLRLAAAGVPATNWRARQATARTLERVEALELDPTQGRLVLVNIAAAEAVAFESGRETLRTKVIVGTGQTPTPQLSTTVPGVRFNPSWYVPASIAPEIFAKGTTGFRVVGGRLIQPPGPTNPLGPIRIGLAETPAVFLHGTSSPGLFAREGRNRSHGCVRVERVYDLAAWILKSTPAALRSIVATGRTTELVPPEEVKVVLAYLTAWPTPEGRLVLYPDPYGLDLPGSRRTLIYRAPPRPAPQPAEPEVELQAVSLQTN